MARNTLSATFRYDQFDFLIDIVPRDDIKPTSSSSNKGREDNSVRMVPDQVSYYFQLAQQQQQQQQAPAAVATAVASTTNQQQVYFVR